MGEQGVEDDVAAAQDHGLVQAFVQLAGRGEIEALLAREGAECLGETGAQATLGKGVFEEVVGVERLTSC